MQGDMLRRVLAEFFGTFWLVLGVTPQMGRTLQEADVDSARQVITLSDRMWRGQFGGRSDIVSTVVRLDGKPFEIILADFRANYAALSGEGRLAGDFQSEALAASS